MGDIGPDAASSSAAIMELLKDEGENEYVRQSAVTALGKIGPATTVVPVLMAVLNDPDVRNEIVEALGEFGPEAAASFPALTELLKDENRWYVRCATVTALGKIGPATAAVPVLTGSLKDVEPRVRSAAAEALGEIGPAASASCPALMELLEDEDRYVWKDAAIALTKIGPATTTIPMLTESLKDDDPNVRSAAADALGEIGAAAAASLPVPLESLKDKRGIVRAAAVEALAEIGPTKAAVPSIMTMLSDEDPESSACRGCGSREDRSRGGDSRSHPHQTVHSQRRDGRFGFDVRARRNRPGSERKRSQLSCDRSQLCTRSLTELDGWYHLFATEALRKITKGQEQE